jgi:aminocarboxymuconate-semialdehyde decarboxylase
VLYGSDYPHNIGSMKGMLRRVNGLPSRTARMVRQSNAEHVFRL